MTMMTPTDVSLTRQKKSDSLAPSFALKTFTVAKVTAKQIKSGNIRHKDAVLRRASSGNSASMLAKTLNRL